MVSEKQLKKNIALNVQRLMTGSKVTQVQLAEAIGVKQATISNILRQINMPSVMILHRIAEFFDSSIDRLTAKPAKSLSKSA